MKLIRGNNYAESAENLEKLGKHFKEILSPEDFQLFLLAVQESSATTVDLINGVNALREKLQHSVQPAPRNIDPNAN